MEPNKEESGESTNNSNPAIESRGENKAVAVGNKPNKTANGDEKAPDSSDNTQQKPKVAKAKKRKKPKDSTAPRHPLTGYVRYLNDRRESVRTSNPNLSFVEITKILANEWTNLPADKKQQYLDAAEQDRERYTREFNAYKQTDAYKLFTQQQQHEKKMKEMNSGGSNALAAKEEEKTQTNPPAANQPVIKGDDSDLTNFDIPIFTEEFLDHNKIRDSELRQLRKSNTDYEQQNSILQKHIDNMKDAITKLENEISQQEKNNASLQKHLEHLRNVLSSGFASVKLPGFKESASQQNIDSYMTNLHSMLLENSSQDGTLLQTVRNIVGKLEFNG